VADLAGSVAQKAKYLPGICAGTLKATLAQVEESGRWDAEGIALKATKAAGAYSLSGTKLFVHDAHNADLLVVPARTKGKGAKGITLFLVDAKQQGVTVTLLKTMDQTRKLCEVNFDNVQVGKDGILGKDGQGARASLSRVWASSLRLSGRLQMLMRCLEEGDRVIALSIEESADLALVRLICADADFGRDSLRQSGFSFSESEVLAVELPSPMRSQPSSSKAFALASGSRQ
jgi:alkylation response protein AidB-like acyl-CoA dehydrogenase